MKLCNETITVFNKRVDPNTGDNVYIPTVINGVSWFCEIATSVGQEGLNAANHVYVRVPIDADFGGKTYVDPIAYKQELIVAGTFTFDMGDIIVKAAITTEGLRPPQIQQTYSDCMTIVGVTDNRRAPNAPHWKVVGK